ncbi:helix-turn-helix domain containing protein [Xanthomonas campestris pv. trichodesmae]|uniref:Bacteriophage CI repressor N-terminal domain-containing protein n=2 Tax=Xanthomonas citri TaxID=346 RepID=A0AB33C989_XANCI|nr:helix-turn-helix domain-containing protein [Xanthomonas citri]ASK91067.1 hypothetical protein XcvCFBP7111P_05740 [Xanthomonas citri pv. vignicola]MBV6779261.1 helix-turn-helix domain containing protein [Xanthomonas campestris pv. trichodesmae]MBZ3921775.1 hypothetical protein [Xanthomonas campestris pv. trichodesmae]MBZ3926375.1 hypothetical protein [Xanthomonas citri pv. sesbaniae]
MREFDRQLLRLKEALGILDDQDVATTLGMTKAAFSARKTRGVFPEDKLASLAVRRPELKLDVGYVMTGKRQELERRLAAIRTATDIAARTTDDQTALNDVQGLVFNALVAQLSNEEQLLVANFRQANPQGRTAILATAAAVAASSTQGSAK